MSGWIKLNREISSHWIWKDPSYLKAWVALLLSVNHEEKKVLIQGELLICKRGQTIMSLSNLVKLFGKEWSIQRVRTFLKLLSDDAMIDVEGLRKTTRVTICKYDSYQSIQHTDNTQTTSKQHTNNKQTTTTKECKELEEVNNDKKFNAKIFLSENLASDNLIKEWFSIRKLKKLANTKTAMEDFMSEVKKSNMDIDEVLRKCIISSWGGFKYSWILKEKNKESVNTLPTKAPNYHTPGETLR